MYMFCFSAVCSPVVIFLYFFFSVPFECHSNSLARDSSTHFGVSTWARCSIFWKTQRKLISIISVLSRLRGFWLGSCDQLWAETTRYGRGAGCDCKFRGHLHVSLNTYSMYHAWKQAVWMFFAQNDEERDLLCRKADGWIIGLSTAILVVQNISRNKSLSCIDLVSFHDVSWCLWVRFSDLASNLPDFKKTMLTSCHSKGMLVLLSALSCTNVYNRCHCHVICPGHIDVRICAWSGYYAACQILWFLFMNLSTLSNMYTCFWTGDLQIW